MARKPARPGTPSPPLVDTAHSGHFLEPAELGIALESETGHHLMIGRWYAAKGLSGVYVSVLQPNMVAAAIIDYDPATGVSKVGAMVPRWGQGNWSGSVDERLRTVRAGLALQESGGKRFLLFGYFSAATAANTRN